MIWQPPAWQVSPPISFFLFHLIQPLTFYFLGHTKSVSTLSLFITFFFQLECSFFSLPLLSWLLDIVQVQFKCWPPTEDSLELSLQILSVPLFWLSFLQLLLLKFTNVNLFSVSSPPPNSGRTWAIWENRSFLSCPMLYL